MNCPIVVYSHSDVSDVFVNVMIPLLQKNVDINTISIIICLNNNAPELLVNSIPCNYKLLFYNDTKSYSDRVTEILQQIDSEYILYLHEDWIPCRKIVSAKIDQCCDYMTKNNMLTMRSYMNHGKSYPDKSKTREIFDTNYIICDIPIADYTMSLQPAIWKRSFLVEIMQKFPNSTIWNLEGRQAQQYMYQFIGKLCYIYDQRSPRNALSSYYFPHIHSIRAGKWTIPENTELIPILKELGVDPNCRGLHYI